MRKAFLPLVARARAYHRYFQGRFYFLVPDDRGIYCDCWESVPADPTGTIMLIESLMEGPVIEPGDTATKRLLRPYKLSFAEALEAVPLLVANPDSSPPGASAA